MPLKSALIAILLLCVAVPVPAQILNTLSGFEDRPGWQGEGSAFVRLSGGNTDLQSYLVTLAGQWERQRNRLRLIGAYDFTRSDGTTESDDRTLHLRHNYRLGEHFSTLAFAQAHHNAFQDLEARELLGAGLRVDLHRDERWRFGLGASAMYEAEQLTDESKTDTIRFSTFVDFRKDLQEYLRFAIVGWYQPEASDFGDVRSSVIADLDVELKAPLTLVLSASWEHDSRPPAGVQKTDWTVRTGMRASI